MVSFSRGFFFINHKTHYSFDEKIHSDISKIRQKLAIENSKFARPYLRYFHSTHELNVGNVHWTPVKEYLTKHNAARTC